MLGGHKWSRPPLPPQVSEGPPSSDHTPLPSRPLALVFAPIQEGELSKEESPPLSPLSAASLVLKSAGLKRPLSMGDETRRGSAHSLRKHVFSVYRGACPVPMLCSLIWSQKKNQTRSFRSEVHLEARKSGLLRAHCAGAPGLLLTSSIYLPGKPRLSPSALQGRAGYRGERQPQHPGGWLGTV